MRIIDEILSEFDSREDKPTRLILRIHAGKELKRSKEMLYYSQLTANSTKFLGMDIEITSDIPFDTWIMK